MVWWGDGNEEELVSLALEYGLYICSAHLPFDEMHKIWGTDDGGDEYADMLCSLVKKCGELSVPTAVLHVSKGVATPPCGEAGLARINRILQAAEHYNVNIAFENLRFVEYLDYVFSHVSSDRMKFCYDSGHHNCYSPERDLLSEYGDKLDALHLDDNMGDSDIHMLPYDGTANWDKVTDRLAALEYDGVISLEVLQDRHERYASMEPAEFLGAAFERALKIENELIKKKAIDKGRKE
jgi:sugar phosphate isomerase/epimerase